MGWSTAEEPVSLASLFQGGVAKQDATNGSNKSCLQMPHVAFLKVLSPGEVLQSLARLLGLGLNLLLIHAVSRVRS